MPSSGKLDDDKGVGIGNVNGSAGSTSISVTDRYAVWRIQPGDIVLIHQTRGNGAGQWELNTANNDVIGSGTFSVKSPLKHDYVTNTANEHAQILRVPQYSDCPITGVVTPLSAWNGDWGGIFAAVCSRTLVLTGAVNANGSGFRRWSGTHQSFRRIRWRRDRWSIKGYFSWANGNGGGGGNGNDGQGAGGGNGTAGTSGYGFIWNSVPGATAGSADLSSMDLGGGGGGASEFNNMYQGGNGAQGGGIVFLAGNISDDQWSTGRKWVSRYTWHRRRFRRRRLRSRGFDHCESTIC